MNKYIAIISLFGTLFAGLAMAHTEHEHLCHEAPTGRACGEHVSVHAIAGHFSGDMNPGIHQGYSICVK